MKTNTVSKRIFLKQILSNNLIGAAGAAIYGITKGVQNGTFKQLPQTVSNAMKNPQMKQLMQPMQNIMGNQNSQQASYTQQNEMETAAQNLQ